MVQNASTHKLKNKKKKKGPWCSPEYHGLKVNTEDKYQISRPNDYEKEKIHNFHRGLAT